MNKDELFLTNRIKELARISYDRNIYTYSDFLQEVIIMQKERF